MSSLALAKQKLKTSCYVRYLCLPAANGNKDYHADGELCHGTGRQPGECGQQGMRCVCVCACAYSRRCLQACKLVLIFTFLGVCAVTVLHSFWLPGMQTRMRQVVSIRCLCFPAHVTHLHLLVCGKMRHFEACVLQKYHDISCA